MLGLTEGSDYAKPSCRYCGQRVSYYDAGLPTPFGSPVATKGLGRQHGIRASWFDRGTHSHRHSNLRRRGNLGFGGLGDLNGYATESLNKRKHACVPCCRRMQSLPSNGRACWPTRFLPWKKGESLIVTSSPLYLVQHPYRKLKKLSPCFTML